MVHDTLISRIIVYYYPSVSGNFKRRFITLDIDLNIAVALSVED